MKLSRRTLLFSAGGFLCGAALVTPRRAIADDTAEYFYDALGRLIRVELSDGAIVVYDYDAAGNRTRVVHGDDVPFNQTLQITGTGPVNLRTVADQAGYTGVTNATITFQVGSTVTISGAPASGIGIDTGFWPSSTKSISLSLEVSGKVYGGGGAGGGQGNAAGVGGDAVYCRENLSILVNAGGQIRGGGGGGGSGGGWRFEADGESTYSYGGGGGGGFPNGLGGAGGPGGTGAAGTTSGGGAGGSGTTIGGGRTVGAGGAGAGAAATGATGSVATGTEGCTLGTCRYKLAPGVGGAAGWAVRKNGKTVNVTNNGTISGTVG